MRDDVVFSEAGVDSRLEDLYALAGDLGAPEPADQLFTLAAEHSPDDHLNPPRRWGSDDVHIATLYRSREAVTGFRHNPPSRAISVLKAAHRWGTAFA